MQHFSFQLPEPSETCTLWETKKNTTEKERSFTLIIVMKCGDKFLHVRTGKSVLYFKSGGKVKSDQLADSFEFSLNRFG